MTTKKKKFPLLIVCSLIVVGLAGTIVTAVFQKGKSQLPTAKNFSLTLKLDETKSFPDKKTKITLQQIVLPPSNQKDGLTQIKILVDKNNQQEELTYKIGGFAGFDVREQKYSSGVVSIEEINPDQVKLNISLNE